MQPLTGKYRGYEIYFNGSFFEIALEGKMQTNRPKDLDACRSWIDKQLKQEFFRTKVIVRSSFGDGFKEAEATSIVEDYRAWVSYADGSREMVSIKSLIAATEENLTKIALIEKLVAKSQSLRNEVRVAVDDLVMFDVNSMFKGETK